MNFKIHPSEVEDFESVLNNSNLDPADFEIKTTDTTKQTNGIFPISGIVTVTAKGTGTSRSFNAGHGTSWVVEFERDLKQGLFH